MTRFCSSLMLAALAAASLPQAVIAEEREACLAGNHLLNGSYVVSGTGAITGLGPIANVGLVVYEGDGTGTLIFSTTTVNGASSTSANVPVSFTVNSDCTGSKQIGPTHFNFVITPDGNKISWIVTDAGVTMTGTGIRIQHR